MMSRLTFIKVGVSSASTWLNANFTMRARLNETRGIRALGTLVLVKPVVRVTA